MTVFWLADQNGRLYTPPRRTELLGNSLASRTNQGTERNVVNSKCSPDTSLFRQQVVEQKKDRLHGDVLLLPRIRHSVVLTILIVWVAAVVFWLATSTYARQETVAGWLEPSAGIIRLYPEASGQIEKILVTEGEKVQKGQPLIVVRADKTLADGNNLTFRLQQEYERQSSLLKEQIERSTKTQADKEASLARQVEAIEHNLTLMKEQLETLDARHDLVKNQLDRYQPGVKDGNISLTEYDHVRTLELSIRSDRQGLLREISNEKDLLSLRRTDLQLLPQETANALNQMQSRLSELAQQAAQLQGERAQVITATRAGIVNNLQASEGQYVSRENAAPLLTLSDGASPLLAHLLIPVRAAGFIEPGQVVDIRYDAFPFQKFGLYQGRIERAARTPLLPGELLNSPVQLQEPVYRVEVRLAEQNVHAYGHRIPLKPGMTLVADIELAERRLWQWLLEPIYSIRGRL